MKVTGAHIKALLEVESTATVRKKLREWGFQDCEYVVTEKIVEHLANLGTKEPFVSYEGKAPGSDKL